MGGVYRVDCTDSKTEVNGGRGGQGCLYRQPDGGQWWEGCTGLLVQTAGRRSMVGGVYRVDCTDSKTEVNGGRGGQGCLYRQPDGGQWWEGWTELLVRTVGRRSMVGGVDRVACTDSRTEVNGGRGFNKI